MSVQRCIEALEHHYDRNKDLDSLIEELDNIDAEALDEGTHQPYQAPISNFLNRVEELLNEEELDEPKLLAAVANLRGDLETLKAKQVPDDPLEHLFWDMTRYQAGTVPSSTTLTTLSRYESLVLALRHQFERSTDPTDESEVATMMRTGLGLLESAGAQLRQDLQNGLDYAFDDLKSQLIRGTDILMEFRRKARFVNEDGEVL